MEEQTMNDRLPDVGVFSSEQHQPDYVRPTVERINSIKAEEAGNAAVEEAVNGAARISSACRADAVQVVNRAIQRRGDSPGTHETERDADTVYMIAELLTRLHRT
jgi:hypothetical protein